MDTKSEFLLLEVDPDLAKVIRKASQQPQRFKVLQGKRSLEQQKANLAKGVSKTLNSRHLGGKDGLADAVDLVAITKEGKLDWAPNREPEVYGQIYKQVKAASDELCIPIEWGGNWKWKDWGHYQLPWSVDREGGAPVATDV